MSDIAKKIQGLQCIACDFDGVMTDNRALIDVNGNELVFVNRSDGLAAAALKKMGIRQVIISTETVPLASARARKLGIDVLQSVENKGAALEEYCAKHGIPLRHTLFIGNDINDIPALEKAGIRCAPKDAEPEVLAVADWVSEREGGRGVMRDLLRWIGSMSPSDARQQPAAQ